MNKLSAEAGVPGLRPHSYQTLSSKALCQCTRLYLDWAGVSVVVFFLQVNSAGDQESNSDGLNTENSNISFCVSKIFRLKAREVQTQPLPLAAPTSHT